MGFDSEEYAACREWVKNQIEVEKKSWEQVRTLCVTKEEAPFAFDKLKNEELIIPIGMEYSAWGSFIDDRKKRYSTLYQPAAISDGNKENLLDIPTSSSSAWVEYKKYLLGDGDEQKRKMTDASIEAVEKDCHWILNHLSRDTETTGPVKGLVMGSVQSGKTANMIGLTAMTADYDWNIVIILSGSIDNLRKQTRDRFYHDLKHSGVLYWHILDHTSNPDYLMDINDKKMYLPEGLKLNMFKQGKSNNLWLHRYVIVCLKNSSRLKRLIKWLHGKSGIAKKMRILVIDDEADQASINTKKMDIMQSEEDIERTKVNQYIIDLVNGRDETGKKTKAPFQAMNYISFTATPYANVLNEAYKTSLYPKNFICSLPESKEYFGAKVIFGSKSDDKNYPGLDIVRSVPEDEADGINIGLIPTGLKKSIAWFICSAAILRLRTDKENNPTYKKPISMLIHTTSLQGGHLMEYDLIRDWLRKESLDVLKLCQSVYKEEIKKFTYADLKKGYPDYSNLQNVDRNMPPFNTIKNEIKEILSSIENIMMGENKTTSYHENAVHLCVDNCQANKYAPEGAYMRIIYPSAEQLKALNKAPVFIVMGGNTLSRGLTIEGLVCTYFARKSNLADTLMQMARWFGYKTGYELLQRIWMPNTVKEKFKLLEAIDEELKNEFERFMRSKISPSEYGPKVMSSSSIAKFMLTSKNKSQRSVECDADFSDLHAITQYDNDKYTLSNNISCTKDFLLALGKAQESSVIKSSLIWRNISTETIIKNFFDKYIISDKSKFKEIMPVILEWIKMKNLTDQHYLKWNVALCGNGKAHDRWNIAGASVGKIKRSINPNKLPCLEIISFISGPDVMSDVDYDNLSNEQKNVCDNSLKSKKDLKKIRASLGLDDTPLLMLYCIDKNGKDDANIAGRSINSIDDVVGFALLIPKNANENNHLKSVTVQIPKKI